MVQEIVWSSLSLKTYLQNIEYLQTAWTQKEIDKFINATDRKLRLLRFQPNIGIVTNKRLNVRKTLIVKRIILIYRYKPRKKIIELVSFFNTWQNPNKSKNFQH